MLAVGRYDLRLTEAEFWRLTLSEYSALLDRWIAEQEREDFRSAQIVCLLANVNRNPKKKPDGWDVSDFMPDYHRRKKPKNGLTKPVMTADQMKNVLMRFARRRKEG